MSTSFLLGLGTGVSKTSKRLSVTRLLISHAAAEADFHAVERKYGASAVVKGDWQILPPKIDVVPLPAQFLHDIAGNRLRLLAEPLIGIRMRDRWKLDRL